MANYLRENPFYLDGAVNIQPPQFGKIYVREVRWENYKPGDVLFVQTGTGGTLINETVNAADVQLDVIRFGPFGWVNGFNVVTLTAGGNITVSITKA